MRWAIPKLLLYLIAKTWEVQRKLEEKLDKTVTTDVLYACVTHTIQTLMCNLVFNWQRSCHGDFKLPGGSKKQLSQMKTGSYILIIDGVCTPAKL